MSNEFKYALKQIKPKGWIAYEYNPLHNYRTDKYYNQKTGETKTKDEYELLSETEKQNYVPPYSIVDLVTNNLTFSLQNPVDMLAQQSYDGSVNLILNDNLNLPRMINSRFTVRAGNKYEIVDRTGSTDTNLYDDNQFDTDTSLYKVYNTIPRIHFNGLRTNGEFPVGNYVFYFRLCDADGNETDFVGESGIVSVYIGNINDPHSIRGGISDENSHKAISFTINNIDSAYDYIKVYYTRSTSTPEGTEVTTAHYIDRQFSVINNKADIYVTGAETIKDISIDDINISYFLADKAKGQAIVQNRLFLGGLHKPSIDYEDFKDLSLRILPYYKVEDVKDTIGTFSSNYVGSKSFMYYNSNNIYEKLGYWPTELYRLGIVYIMQNGTLSPVFNIRGGEIKEGKDSCSDFLNYPLNRKGSSERYYIPINDDFSITSTEEVDNSGEGVTLENSKGVIRISAANCDNQIISLGFYIPGDVLERIQKKIKGFFFVRQKRIPGILAQALTIGNDQDSGLPLIQKDNDFVIESFLDKDQSLTQSYSSRLRSAGSNNIIGSAICPEYELRQPYFNNLFTGTNFPVKKVGVADLSTTLTSERQYYAEYKESWGVNNDLTTIQVQAIPDNVEAIRVNDYTFKARAGQAEESYKLELVNGDVQVRGSFGPYLGLTNYNGSYGDIINIYRPGYSLNSSYNNFQQQYFDDSAYYCISDRYNITDMAWTINEDGTATFPLQNCKEDIYRGDCYICQYTHRLNRNFQDPEAPTNDKIVDNSTWKENYKDGDNESNANINRGDVNAIQLGSWITFTVRSNINLSLRNWDDSYPTEFGLTGVNRGFYPLQSMSVSGNYKIPESFMQNAGLSSTTSDRYNFLQPDVPYIKNNFDTRIAYSDIAVNDAFKNGLRVFQATSYRDYPIVYGGITKLLEFYGQLICIFEHGVALIPVNERVVAGSGAGGDAFINTSNVLPENPNMLSDQYGSQWGESVIKTPYYIYGVDTVAKKIWRTNGQKLECISEFSMTKFLIDNITLGERELTPIIGVRNVKTHYNAYKGDVMFTFYDNLTGFEEKVWNLCWNEQLNKWVTFYSWVPSYSENIDNQFYSFDRNTSKIISKLAISSHNNPDATGITVESNTDLPDTVITGEGWSAKLHYDASDYINIEDDKLTVHYTYELVDGFKKQEDWFNLTSDGKLSLISGHYTDVIKEDAIYLHIRVSVDIEVEADQTYKEYVEGWKDFKTQNIGLFESNIALISKDVYENNRENGATVPENSEIPSLTTDFWKHGQGGLIDVQQDILPCYWYGNQHPFEFEFVVNQDPGKQKIWTNLQIISNKVIPESLHYSIFGDSYEFSEDKKNMFVRQELTKMLYQNIGSDILYNHAVKDLVTKMYKLVQNSNDKGNVDGNYDLVLSTSDNLTRNPISTIFPLYYERIDSYNDIYDFYQLLDGGAVKDYQNLSGTEVTYDSRLNKFGITVHQKAVDMQKYGRIRGNMQYQEDLWRVQIPSIIYQNKNESDTDWNSTNGIGGFPPITLLQVPNDIKTTEITQTELPVFDLGVVNIQPIGIDQVVMGDQGWTARKETRLRDKFLQIRVRYTGNELVTIQGMLTDYLISNA